MYNPDALTQALETGAAVEKALLDTLRGPDAAHRLADEQIREIITLPAFKPRHGRLMAENAYVDADHSSLFLCHRRGSLCHRSLVL